MREFLNVLQNVQNGYSEFITDYKYLALIICVLFYEFCRWRQEKNQKARKFLMYTCIMVVALHVPVTALLFLKYQTGFYGYTNIWNYVPLTAILAWGIVILIFRELPGNAQWKEKISDKKIRAWRLLGMVAAVAILFVAGNQGKMLCVSGDEENIKQKAEEILQYMEENERLKDCMIWGAKDIMQYMRAHNGEVVLYYGRDMWDGAAGAYDYEGYEEDEIACYEWMELVSSPHNLFLLEINQAPEHVHEALATELYIKNAVKDGVTTIILPESIGSRMERKIELVSREFELDIESMVVGEFIIWELSRSN
jgi:hypothetical protein